MAEGEADTVVTSTFMASVALRQLRGESGPVGSKATVGAGERGPKRDLPLSGATGRASELFPLQASRAALLLLGCGEDGAEGRGGIREAGDQDPSAPSPAPLPTPSLPAARPPPAQPVPGSGSGRQRWSSCKGGRLTARRETGEGEFRGFEGGGCCHRTAFSPQRWPRKPGLDE